MTLLDVVCRARTHDSELARAAGCVCPVGWGQPYRPPQPETRRPRRKYIPGRVSNKLGPNRRVVTEPDWVAVERAIAGDKSLTLAKVERDAAIDQLDRRGLSAREIAIRLGLTQRTVQRRRAVRRAQGGGR